MIEMNIVDCCEAMAAIERHRQYQATLGKDITPTLIGLGVQAIVMDNPRADLGAGWNQMLSGDRWRRVRARLTAEGITTVLAKLDQKYGALPAPLNAWEVPNGQKA